MRHQLIPPPLAGALAAATLVLGVAAACNGGEDLVEPPASCPAPSGAARPLSPVSAAATDPGCVAAVSVTPTADTLTVDGGIGVLVATARDATGAIVHDARYRWTLAEGGVVQLQPSEDGERAVDLRGIAPGTTTVSVTSNGLSASATVTVLAGNFFAGRVYDAVTGDGIQGATVTLRPPAGPDFTATTGPDGQYLSPPHPFLTLYLVIASAPGYIEATQHDPPRAAATGDTTSLAPIPLVPAGGSTGGIGGVVRNARTGAGVPNALVTLHAGVNSAIDSLDARIADAAGVFTFTGVRAGTYTVRARADGYSAAGRTGIVVGDGTVRAEQDVVLSPAGARDVRIVLTWGPSPPDLDAHLTGPSVGANRFHIFYGERGDFAAPPFAGLDVDDVAGFGPETITITQLAAGTYRFSVHDFTNRESAASTALARSAARVEVYPPSGPSSTFFVPNRNGNLWTVFELSGSIESPAIVPRNTVTFVEDPTGVPAPPATAGVATDAAPIGAATRAGAKPGHGEDR